MKATIKESLLAAGKQVEAAEHAAMALEKSAEMVHRSAGMMAAVPDWIDSIFVKDASFAERSKRPTHDCTSFKAWFARCKVAWTLGGTEKPELPDYDAEISLFNTVFSWHGTVMPLVFNKPLFWLQLLLHGGLAAWHEVALAQMDEGEVMEGGLYDDADALQWATLSIPSSLVVFFIVFYSSQCYARFFELYGHCVGISGALMCWVAQDGQSGRLGGATAGLHGPISLHLKAWGCSTHSEGEAWRLRPPQEAMALQPHPAQVVIFTTFDHTGCAVQDQPEDRGRRRTPRHRLELHPLHAR